MHIHYVVDSDLSETLLAETAQASVKISISESSCLKDCRHDLELSTADCVVLDIDRCAGKSLEEDVRRIREASDAPMIFVTSGPVESCQGEAIAMGAITVLHRDEISAARVERALLTAHSEIGLVGSGKAHFVQPLFSVDSEAAPFRRLLNIISQQSAYLLENDAGKHDPVVLAEELHGMINSLKLAARSNTSPADDVPITNRLASIRKFIAGLTARAEQKFLFEMTEQCFSKMGDPMLVELALRHLAEGMIRSAAHGDTMAIYAYEHGSNISLVAMSNKRTISDVDQELHRKSVARTDSPPTTFALSLAALLFGVDRAELKKISSGSVQRLIMRFPDRRAPS